jgi:hypothetical protein
MKEPTRLKLAQLLSEKSSLRKFTMGVSEWAAPRAAA